MSADFKFIRPIDLMEHSVLVATEHGRRKFTETSDLSSSKATSWLAMEAKSS